jgi:hypothetical protein
VSEINELLTAYEDILSLPWQNSLSGQEKVWFIIYDPSNERRIRLRISEFELKTIQAGYRWLRKDISDVFAEWMAALDYREAYFEHPRDMDPMLKEFTEHVIGEISNVLKRADDNTVVAIDGIASLFGLSHVSDVISGITSHIKGRLLVFFPGRYDGSVYRLLDARDGWNYLALPITAN